MQNHISNDWFEVFCADGLSLDLPGIYEWRVETIGVYVGKAKRLKSRIRAYPNNVRRMTLGQPWHGNPERDYRPIHYALLRAYSENLPVSAVVLENCEAELRASRERHWIALRLEEERHGGPKLLNSIGQTSWQQKLSAPHQI